LEPKRIRRGLIGGIGAKPTFDLDGQAQPSPVHPVANHRGAVDWMFEQLEDESVDAVGHRVVHGGDRFVQPTALTPETEAAIEALSELAPLHNPPALAAIRAARAHLLPTTPMVATFDTAFHATLPAHAAQYAIDPEWAARNRIRRYGFHGVAHRSMMETYVLRTGRAIAGHRVITIHLGNGCSMTAIKNGRSVDTSMGFTPLEGLVMGTRSGDIDPAVVTYVAEREGRSAVDTVHRLNPQSGLLGVSGCSNDMRVVAQAANSGHARARLALAVFCYRVKRYLGAYLAALGGADAVLFGGGIGEHQATVRAEVCKDMAWCGLELSDERNGSPKP